MRIVHVINTLKASDGGPPIVAGALAIAQARLGHEVHLLTYTDRPENADGRGVLAGMAGKELVRLHTVERRPFERFWARRATVALRPLLAGTDAVHIHGIWPTICLGAGRACRRAGVPYVVIPHGSLNDWTLAERAAKKKLALALAYRSFIRGASWVHATSQYEADCTRSGGFHPDIRVIPPGVEPALLGALPARDAYGRRNPSLAGRQYVVFVARLHPGKGADLLAEAIGLLRDRGIDLHAVVAGPDAGARPAIEQAIARSNTGDRVHLVGPLWGEPKLEALTGALAFCLPSKGESFGLAIAEAMAVGTPVVITTECHFGEAERAGAALIVERTPAAIADALARFVADSSLRERCGAAGRALVTSRYSWPAVAQQIIDGYLSSTNSRR